MALWALVVIVWLTPDLKGCENSMALWALVVIVWLTPDLKGCDNKASE